MMKRKFLKMKSQPTTSLNEKQIAARIALVYLLAAASWILFVEVVLQQLGLGLHLVRQLETLSEWVFVLTSAILLFIVLNRTFAQRRRAEECLRLLQSMTKQVIESEDLHSALTTVLRNVCETSSWPVAGAWIPEKDGSVLYFHTGWAVEAPLQKFLDQCPNYRFAPGVGLPGRVWKSLQPVWVRDVTIDDNFPRAPHALAAGLKTGVGIPVLDGDGLVVVIEFFLRRVREEDERLVQLISAVAAQLGAAIQRKRAREELKHAHSLLSATLEATADGVLVVDSDGKITSFNDKFIQMWRLPAAIITARDDVRAIQFVLDQLEDPDVFLSKVNELYSRPDAHSFDILRFKDGRTLERHSQPQCVGEKIVGRVWTFHDVTERVTAEAEVRRLNEDLEERVQLRTEELEEVNHRLAQSTTDLLDLYNNAPCGYHTLTADGTFVAVNSTLQRWLGYAHDELIGKTKFTDLLTAQCIPLFVDILPALHDGHTLNDLEFEMIRKDSSVMSVLLNLTPITTMHTHTEMIRVTVYDVTDRNRDEKKLRENEQRLAEAQRIARLGRWTWDLASGTITWNELMYEIFDVDPGLQPTVEMFQHALHPDDKSSALHAIQAALASDVSSYTREYRVVGRSGNVRYVHAISNIIRTDDRKPARVVGTAQDVTERKRAEEAIGKLNNDLHRHAAELETANKELEAFSYSVSHDLRGPLRHIDGFVDLLQKHLDASLDEKGRRYLNIVSASARRMGNLIDDLLLFSRMGRVELQATLVDQNDLVNDVLRDLRHDVGVRSIEWDIMPLSKVHADPDMLRLVYVNLISNALKYSRTRTPSQIEIGEQFSPTGEPVFFVRDNGVGFDMKYVDKLFGVFQRLHRSDEFEGTGVGLANVRRIIQRHSGRTWAEGAVDRGATFYFTLPTHTTGEV